jgi:hypothetical protein
LNSDGSVHFGTSSHYLEMGISTNHPKVSGLNCQGGIAMNQHGISGVSSLSVYTSGENSVPKGTYTGRTEVMYLAGSIGFSFQNHTFT